MQQLTIDNLEEKIIRLEQLGYRFKAAQNRAGKPMLVIRFGVKNDEAGQLLKSINCREASEYLQRRAQGYLFLIRRVVNG